LLFAQAGLLISASPVTRIIGLSHHAWLYHPTFQITKLSLRKAKYIYWQVCPANQELGWISGLSYSKNLHCRCSCRAVSCPKRTRLGRHLGIKM
jgi:hypothetical protein